MNKQQRNQWDNTVDKIINSLGPHIIDINLIVAANTHILKLERELQNIKQGKKIAAILTKGNDAVSF